jgi:CheY-like chemotaxis protein
MDPILIVMHNRGEMRRIAARFEQAGYAVLTAGDGMAGYDLFKTYRPVAVVIDVLIPKLPGGELSLMIKADPLGAHVPVVLISGLFKQTDMAERAIEQWRADRFYPSPVDVEALVDDVVGLVAVSRRPKVAGAAARFDQTPEAPPRAEESLEDLLAKTVAELSQTNILDRAPRVARINEEIRAAQKPAAPSSDPLAALLAEMETLSADPSADAEAAEPEPATEEELPLEGNLADAGVPELFAHLFFTRRTGILELNSRGVFKHVYFEAGRAVYVESESRQESLGQFLVRQGMLSEQDVMLSLENMAAYGRRQGGALVELGMLNPMQLYQALRLQMREKIVNAFAWFEGRYYFDETPFDKTSLTIFDLPMPRLIFDGIQHAYNEAAVESMFADVLNQIVIPAGALPFERLAADLPDDVWGLLVFIDGRRTIAQIVAAAPYERGRTFLLLYVMLILRLFDKTREEEVAVDLAPPPRMAPPKPRARPTAPPPRAPEPAARPAAPPKPAAPPVKPAPKPPVIPPDAPPKVEKIEAEEEVVVFEDLPDETALTPIDEPRAAPPETAPAVDEGLLFEFEDATPAAPADAGQPAPQSESADLEAELRQFEAEEPGAPADHVASPVAEALVLIDEAVATEAGDEPLAQQLMDLYVRLETANYYELLAVEPNADPLAIKMAYHALMKKFHADKLATQLPASMQEQATRVVQALTQAYEVLSSLKQRGEYDRRLTGEGAEIKERRITTILAAERAFNQGTLALRRQQYDQAATHFAEACELFPEEAEYHAYLGWAQFNHKAVPAAERAA